MSLENPANKIDLTLCNSSPTLENPATWLGGPPLIHQNVTLLECVSENILEEVLTATDLRYAVVRRISPRVIMVDPRALDEMVKALTRRGYEPRIIKPETK